MYWNESDYDYVTAIWQDAPDVTDTEYSAYMEASNALCVAYAPALSEGAEIPTNYRMAEVYWAMHLWAGTRADANGSMGAPDYSIPVARYDLKAQDLLRPKSSALRRLR
ncbi:hypothetical protein ACFUOZ_04655 [Paenarthrobacter sp. NPDC057355]|uniref:hypothetical protein n=1 Tax=Paenarthrobacter sp. NPDC057355 TaxID=3346105 RepID=UPI00363303BB